MIKALLLQSFILWSSHRPLASSFVIPSSQQYFQKSPTTSYTLKLHTLTLHATNNHNDDSNYIIDTTSRSNGNNYQRRSFLQSLILTPSLINIPSKAIAMESTTTSTTTTTIEMKTFTDPKGLFIVNIPTRFFAIRRTDKGDLPDEKTGKGRRGSSIFTAGDMAKAEIIAIERYPIKVLLEEEGIVPSGDLTTFTSIGDGYAIAKMIASRRDKDKKGEVSTVVVPNSVSVSQDGKLLYFTLASSIQVQKPELLMEQTGRSELSRITKVKASLASNDGQMLSIFASALEQDMLESEDGKALEDSVNSFISLDQSSATKF